MEMENNQIEIEEIAVPKQEEQPKQSKEKPFLYKVSKLEKDVARLERQIDIIIKSLRR